MKIASLSVYGRPFFFSMVGILSLMFCWIPIVFAPVWALPAKEQKVPPKLKPFLPMFVKFDPNACRLELHGQKEIDAEYSVWILRATVLEEPSGRAFWKRLLSQRQI
jgi:hypothetical protein